MAAGDALEALESNCWSMWSQFGRGPDCALVDEPGLLRYETPIGRPPYNTVMRFHDTGGDVGRRVDGALEPYRRRDVPVTWLVHPTSSPDDLRARLKERGLAHAETLDGMAAPIAALAPPALPDDVTVERADASRAAPFIELVSWRYGLDRDDAGRLAEIYQANRFCEPGSPNQAWVARVGGQAVAKVVLHVDGDTAGLYGLATLPEARGRGLAAALTLLAYDEARRMGATIAILHSTPMAVGLYRKLGFEHVADFEIWAEPDTLHL